jgi:glycosyltransferase involved in cell wall biosynthesis
MTRPKISLLIPCYNAAGFLPRLMATVREQTQPFAEIICYDDGSTDQTVQVARDLGLTIISGDKNRGPAYARNRLAEAAQHPWIHFHDADDLLTPQYVEKISPLLDAETDIAVCQMDWVLETTRELEIAWRFKQEEIEADPVIANLNNPIGVIACVFRREQFLKIGGFKQEFRTWEDGDLQVRLSAIGARYRVHPEVLVIGLRHGRGASSVQNGDLVFEDRTRLLEIYIHTLGPRYQRSVAAVAESHAAWLLASNHRLDLAERDLAVCRLAGWRIPSSNHPALRLARQLLPGRWLLKQQTKYRWRTSK